MVNNTPSMASYFNPLDDRFRAMDRFSNLSRTDKALVVILTGVIGFFTLGVGATPLFRKMVQKLSSESIFAKPEVLKTTEIGVKFLSSQQKKTKEFDPISLNKEVPKTFPLGNSEKKIDLRKPETLSFEKNSFPSNQEPLKSSQQTQECKDALSTYLKERGKQFGNAVDNGDCFFDAMAQSITDKLHTMPDVKQHILEIQQDISKKGYPKIFIDEKTLTLKDIKVMVQSYADAIHEKVLKEGGKNWIRETYKGESIATYEEYINHIGLTADELPKGCYPVWGLQNVDALIISEMLGIKINIFVVDRLPEESLHEQVADEALDKVVDSAVQQKDQILEENFDELSGSDASYEYVMDEYLENSQEDLGYDYDLYGESAKNQVVAVILEECMHNPSQNYSDSVDIALWPGHFVPVFGMKNTS